MTTRRRNRSFFGSLAIAAITAGFNCREIRAAESPDFLRDGDRIVSVGDTLIEREQRYGYLETNLHSRYATAKLRFRNLGWSADSVEGLSRAYFDPPNVGKTRLNEQLAAVKPTVLIAGYGMAASFDGPAGVAPFRTGLTSLLATAKGLGVRTSILLSPISHEPIRTPPSDADRHNQSLALYAQAIRDVANNTGPGVRQVDLSDALKRSNAKAEGRPAQMTDNGIHLTQAGYWFLALEIERLLGLPSQPIATTLAADGRVIAQSATLVRVLEASSEGLVFEQHDHRLPTLAPPSEAAAMSHPQAVRISLTVTGLHDGNYALWIDDERVALADAAQWASGIVLARTPAHAQAEALRQLVCRKDRLYFNRYRPQNITYLIGFRKYEQGQNARDIEELDRKVTEAESAIHQMSVPKSRRFVLARIP